MKKLKTILPIMFLPYSLVSCTNIANYYLKGTKINSNINVIDGDTVSFLENDKKKYIRLFGIDTPETFKNDNKKLAKFENYYAHQARIFLNHIIRNKELFYKFIKYDKYNRIIAILYYKTGKNEYSDAGLELVKNGYARVHYISDSPTDKYGVNEKNLIEYFYKLKKEENKAKMNLVNIWKHNQRHVFYKP
ncbi:nuclease [Mycoplasmopsis bovis]|uniref:thermonuclease family protein n=1 Tax=Mycoplasmopsis bovis TaxID=28903 RepID=UPI001430DA1C|nr:thermonuclease family protein [Mycoplasmopsis bovis]QIT08443.1 nuclease [Mycoplasmopsis bovis]